MEFKSAESKELTETEGKAFGEKLYTLRKKKGLSQQEVAEALQVSRQAVSRWEVGASVPTIENLAALSKLYAVPVDKLIGNRVQERKEMSCHQEDKATIREDPVQPKLCMNKKLLASMCLVSIAIGMIIAGWYLWGMNQRLGDEPEQIENLLVEDVSSVVEEDSFL